MKNQFSNNFFSKTSKEVAEKLIGAVLCISDKKNKKQVVILATSAHEGGNITLAREGMNFPAAMVFIMRFRGHFFINITTDRKNNASCVMIKKIKVIEKDNSETIIDGPGRVTKFLGIDEHWNGVPLGQKIWIEKPIQDSKIKRVRAKLQSENCQAQFQAND